MALGLLLGLNWGCQKPVEQTFVVAAPKVEAKLETPQVDAMQMLDSMEQESTVLAKSFDFKQQDFTLSSYYHKQWWGRYWMRSNIIMAGVDSAGTFFLILNYNCSGSEDQPSQDARRSFLPLDCDQQTSGLQLELKDTTIFLPTAIDSTAPALQFSDDRFPTEWVISTGRYCTEFYVPSPTMHLEEYFISHEMPLLRGYNVVNGKRHGAKMTMGKESREAIRDCARFALVIQKLGELRK